MQCHFMYILHEETTRIIFHTWLLDKTEDNYKPAITFHSKNSYNFLSVFTTEENIDALYKCRISFEEMIRQSNYIYASDLSDVPITTNEALKLLAQWRKEWKV